jgi:cytochrome P450 family 6
VFFLAGFETSSTVLSYTLLELAANPDVQRKAQLEIDEALGPNNGEVSYDSLKSMKYLDWILQGIFIAKHN